jgi:hypothetical protein
MSLPAHNDPLAGKTAKQIYQDCIWFSNESTETKLFLLCIARFFDADAKSSSMSYSQVARECGLSERQAKYIAKRIGGIWLRVEIGKGFRVPGKGCQNLYHGIIPTEVVEALRSFDPQRAAQIIIERKRVTVERETTTINMTGVHPMHPDEVHTMHPEPVAEIHRGAWRDKAGCTPCTRTSITDMHTTASPRMRGTPVDDHDFEEFNSICNRWGRKPGAVIVRPTERGITDDQLISELKAISSAHSDKSDLLVAALRATFNVMRAAIADDAAKDERPKGSGFKSATGYFRKVLVSQLNELDLAKKTNAAAAASEKHIQATRYQRRMDGIRSPSRSANDDRIETTRRNVFGDSQ